MCVTLHQITPFSREVWKQINLAPDYEVSNFGRLKVIKAQRALKITIVAKGGGAGYARVNLRQLTPDGSKKTSITYLVHKLVMLAFVGPRPITLKHIGHYDHQRGNNHLSNLEYCTPKQNIHHGMKSNRNAWGERAFLSRLQKEDVLLIRRLHAEDISPEKIGRAFRLPVSTVRNICDGHTWKQLLTQPEIVAIKAAKRLRALHPFKLTDDQVRDIRNKVAAAGGMRNQYGFTKQLASEFNISISVIYKIVRREIRTDI